MLKTVFKEIIITLLLCLAIILVLSILFYDYNPITKVIPNKVAYTVPENIKNELEEEKIQNSFEIENKVYTIESSDLNIYKKSNSYNPGKANPFAATASEVTNPNTNTSNSESQTNTNANTINNSTNTNSTNTTSAK